MELSHTDVEGIWQKDGIRVKPNNHWRVSTNGLIHGLTLSNLTLEDTGTIVFSAEGVRTTARLTIKGEYWLVELCGCRVEWIKESLWFVFKHNGIKSLFIVVWTNRKPL